MASKFIQWIEQHKRRADVAKYYAEKWVESAVMGRKRPAAVARVPLMITREMRQELLALGHSVQEIKHMKPKEALALLGREHLAQSTGPGAHEAEPTEAASSHADIGESRRPEPQDSVSTDSAREAEVSVPLVPTRTTDEDTAGAGVDALVSQRKPTD
jgi:hypothetical protein